MAESQKTAAYKVIADTGGGRVFRFYCDISGELLYTSPPIRAETEEQALAEAWKAGKREFSRCRNCGRWVSDLMFNPDTMQCVDCTPWEDLPFYCRECGLKLERDVYPDRCPRCGALLMGGEDETEDEEVKPT